MMAMYECLIGFTYEAAGPVDAAEQFLDNLRMPNTHWNVTVNEMHGKQESYSYDSEDGGLYDESVNKDEIPSGLAVTALFREMMLNNSPLFYAEVEKLAQEFDERVAAADWLTTYNGTTFDKGFVPGGKEG